MRVLAQSSTPTIMILLVSSSDHITGLTGVSPTVTISKNGGTFAALDVAATVTEVSAGWYKVHLTANDTATLGDLVLHATATGADPSDRLLFVESTDVSGLSTKVQAIPTNPLITTDTRLSHLNADISSRAVAGDAMMLTSVERGTLLNTDPPGLTLLRKLAVNKAVVSPDGLSVTIYDDDGTTPLQVYHVSEDQRTRAPA